MAGGYLEGLDGFLLVASLNLSPYMGYYTVALNYTNPKLSAVESKLALL